MEVTIEITNINCKIVEKLSDSQLMVLRDLCSFEMEGSEYKAKAFQNKGKDWDGRRKLFNIQTRKFPIGLLWMVTNHLQKYGIDVKWVNHRSIITSNVDYNIANFEDRPYQYGAVLDSVIYGNGIVKAATGSGKTTIAARTIAVLRKNAIFMVHTRDLLYQTKESFERMFPDEKIGQIGDGVFDCQHITVATIQTLAKLSDIEYESYKYDEDDDGDYIEKLEVNELLKEDFIKYTDCIGIVMCDEVQRICSQTAYAARFIFKNAGYAFGYSASPWRDDGSDLMIEAAFGHRICDIPATMLIRLGYLVRPIIDIYPVNNNTWSGTAYQQIYDSAIVNNTLRNLQVVNDAYNQYKLGRNTLVLITLIKHGKIIEEMLNGMGAPAVFISGKSGMKKRRKVIQDMRDGNAPIVIASTIADVGLDVPRLQSIVEAGAGKSSVSALQRLGRIMRPFEGKDYCYFITYRDNAPFLRQQIDKKIQIWRTEEDFVIIEH
jgi:superfamily II DNA or RNA helicase